MIRTRIKMIRSMFESVLTQAAGRFQPILTACWKVMVYNNDNNCNITFDNVFLITIMLVITLLYLK